MKALSIRRESPDVMLDHLRGIADQVERIEATRAAVQDYAAMLAEFDHVTREAVGELLDLGLSHREIARELDRRR